MESKAKYSFHSIYHKRVLSFKMRDILSEVYPASNLDITGNIRVSVDVSHLLESILVSFWIFCFSKIWDVTLIYPGIDVTWK